jgi:outer membrane protein TolC
MKKTALLISMALLCNLLKGQVPDSLSLFYCLRTAEEKSPLTGQKLLSGKALEYKMKNLSSNWFPAIDFNGQANYASETVHFSDYLKDLPIQVSIPSLPLDQYKIWADLNQKIFDGGIIRAQKSIERASYEADLQQVETALLGVKQQVNQSFFALLIARKSNEILQVSLDELRERKKVVRAGIENGAVLPENMLSMDAEELRIQQMILELNITQQQLLNVLSILMDTTISGHAVFIQPDEPISPDQQILRPEYLLFEKQKEMLQASKSLVTAADMPKLFAFSQGAYGRPGYNFLSRDFHAFYSVGVGMKWDFLNYGDSRRKKKLFDIQQDMIEIRRETFDDQLDIQLQAEKTNQAKYTELLMQDEKILKLRKAIAAASFSKLTHGIITSTDYLAELNRAILAGLQYENHKILKLQAAYNYLLLQGKL